MLRKSRQIRLIIIVSRLVDSRGARWAPEINFGVAVGSQVLENRSNNFLLIIDLWPIIIISFAVYTLRLS